MVTLSIDDRLASAQMITDIMKRIDPDGTHKKEKDPVAALEKVVNLHPDIVWLDIEMSGMNGLELAAKIRKKITVHKHCLCYRSSGICNGWFFTPCQRFSCKACE